MEHQLEEHKFLDCQVCKLKYDKAGRLPVFMMCCRQTACENCVYTKMCSSLKTPSGAIPDGKFYCILCQRKVYAPKGVEKNLPVVFNDACLLTLDAQEYHMPIFCDAFPKEHAIWYSTSTKKLVSSLEFLK